MIIKSILFNIIFYFTILFFGVLFLPSLISKKLTRLVVKFWSSIILYFLQNLIGAEIKYENNYIYKNKGYLIAANHQSVFDTIFFLKQFDKAIYVVKKELKFLPIYGWYAMRLGNIFVDRRERIKSVKKISEKVNEAIKKKYKVIIFPEGTRQLGNKIGPMKPGIFAIQRYCKIRVYPIFISSFQVWPKNTYIKSSMSIIVKSLKPLDISFDKKKFLYRLENKFKKELKET